MPEKAIFISHSSKDYEIAKRFCDTFEANGLECWIAPRDIPYGAEWAETIVRGIRSSSLMLVLLTKHSAASRHVIREIHAAIRNDIRVLYVRLDSAPLSDGLAYYLDILQEIDIDLTCDPCCEKLSGLAAYIKTHFSGFAECGAAERAVRHSHPNKEVSEPSAVRGTMAPQDAGALKAGRRRQGERYSTFLDRPGEASEEVFSDMMRGLLKKQDNRKNGRIC